MRVRSTRGTRLLAQAAEVWQQLRIHEGPRRASRFERGRELGAHGLRAFSLLCFALVQDAEEEDPGQLRDVLERARAIRASHDVADTLDRSVDGLRGGEALAVAAGPRASHQAASTGTRRAGSSRIFSKGMAQ